MKLLALLATVGPLAKKYEPELALVALATYHYLAKHEPALALGDLLEAAQELGLPLPPELEAVLGIPQAETAPQS